MRQSWGGGGSWREAWGKVENKRTGLGLLARGLGYGVVRLNEQVGLVNKIEVVNRG
jgi:hypothetical protein